MNKKTVYHATGDYVKRDDSDQVARALSILISKDGAFRTNEKWVYSALKKYIAAGYVKVDGNLICIGADFESLLFSLLSENPRFSSLLLEYRRYADDLSKQYDVTDMQVLDRLDSIKSTDEKIAYLTKVVADTFGKLEAAISRTQELEAKLREMDISLSVVESIAFEDSDS